MIPTFFKFQALQCRLAYIDLRFEEAQSYVLSHVIGSSFVAEVMVPPSENTMATVVLHNTEHEGKPVNMNFNILNEIIKSLSCPKLPLVCPSFPPPHVSLWLCIHVNGS